MALNLNELIPGTNLEGWKFLVSGEDYGAIKGEEVTFNITEEKKFLRDVSTQLAHRVVAVRMNRDFGLSLVLYDFDFDNLADLLDLVVSSSKLRDQVKSRYADLPIVLQGPKVLNFETAVTAETITMTPGGASAGPHTFSLAQDRIKPGSLSFSDSDTSEAFTDDEYGRLTGDAGGSGYYNLETGDGTVTLAAAPSVAIAVTDGAYTYYTDKTVEVRFPRPVISFAGDTSFLAGEGTGIPIMVEAMMGEDGYSMEIEFVT